MWRALETELRQLLNGHEEGNLGYKPRRNLRATAPALDPTGLFVGSNPNRNRDLGFIAQNTFLSARLTQAPAAWAFRSQSPRDNYAARRHA